MSNGRLNYSDLTEIDNGQWLRPDAATRYLALLAAAAADGVRIVTTEGYRDYDAQVRLWNLYGYPRASRPGLSPHGWGLAVDINTVGFWGTVFNWMTKNAARFGFNNRVGRSINEHWHWVYDGTGTAGLDTTPFPEKANTRRKNMTTRYARIDSDPNDPLCALAGENPGQGDANWIEYRLGKDIGGKGNLAAQEAAVHGSAVWLTKEIWEERKALYTSQSPLTEILAQLEALPKGVALAFIQEQSK